MGDLSRALSLSTAERTAALQEFFGVHPGGVAAGPPGLGRAMLDFLSWEVDSGRVTDGAGSGWWKAVNGFLSLDLLAALGRTGLPGSPARAWRAYASAPPPTAQTALWLAHDRSITRAAARARPLLRAEAPAEHAFTRVVLGVLREVTHTCEPTGTPALGRRVRRLYPRRYPIGDEEMRRLLVALSIPAGPVVR